MKISGAVVIRVLVLCVVIAGFVLARRDNMPGVRGIQQPTRIQGSNLTQPLSYEEAAKVSAKFAGTAEAYAELLGLPTENGTHTGCSTAVPPIAPKADAKRAMAGPDSLGNTDEASPRH